MKHTIYSLSVLTSFICSFAHAAPVASELSKIREWSGSLVANGDVSAVTTYNPAQYDEYDEQKQAVLDFINDGGCANGGIKPRANIDSNVKLIEKLNQDASGDIDPASDAQKMNTLVKQMKAQNKFKAILSVSWDEKEEATESADGVACSIYLVRFFTNDGKKLTVFYSITD